MASSVGWNKLRTYPADITVNRFNTSHGSRFRIAYDQLKRHHSLRRAAKQYLLILWLAAKVSEELVEQALGQLLDRGSTASFEQVRELVLGDRQYLGPAAVTIAAAQVSAYDALLVATPSGRREGHKEALHR